MKITVNTAIKLMEQWNKTKEMLATYNSMTPSEQGEYKASVSALLSNIRTLAYEFCENDDYRTKVTNAELVDIHTVNLYGYSLSKMMQEYPWFFEGNEDLPYVTFCVLCEYVNREHDAVIFNTNRWQAEIIEIVLTTETPFSAYYRPLVDEHIEKPLFYAKEYVEKFINITDTAVCVNDKQKEILEHLGVGPRFHFSWYNEAVEEILIKHYPDVFEKLFKQINQRCRMASEAYENMLVSRKPANEETYEDYEKWYDTCFRYERELLCYHSLSGIKLGKINDFHIKIPSDLQKYIKKYEKDVCRVSECGLSYKIKNFKKANLSVVTEFEDGGIIKDRSYHAVMKNAKHPSITKRMKKYKGFNTQFVAENGQYYYRCKCMKYDEKNEKCKDCEYKDVILSTKQMVKVKKCGRG